MGKYSISLRCFLKESFAQGNIIHLEERIARGRGIQNMLEETLYLSIPCSFLRVLVLDERYQSL